MEERTYVNDIDRSIYDIRNEEKDAYRIETGLSPAIVEQISREKGDPLWMELFRLESLQIYNNMKMCIRDRNDYRAGGPGIYSDVFRVREGRDREEGTFGRACL